MRQDSVLGLTAEAAPRVEGDPTFVPQIDALRAAAVGMVFVVHFAHRIAEAAPVFNGILLFFVISGFLITRILLAYRDRIENKAVSRGSALWTFYARRFIRIFPAYYLLLAVMAVLGADSATLAWHLTYSTNIWSALNNRFAPDGGHFWSLAVEEQFYLVWPFLILMLPRAWLVGTMLTLALASLGFRFAAEYFGWGLAGHVLTFGNLHSLAGGGLLAWAHYKAQTKWISSLRRYGLYFFLCAPALWVQHIFFSTIVYNVLMTLIAVYLVDQCVKGYRGWLGAVMSFPPILYLGTISYGLYLWHILVQRSFHIPLSGPLGGAVNALAWTLVSILVASVSWFLFEKPLNGLKSRFTVRPRPSGGDASP